MARRRKGEWKDERMGGREGGREALCDFHSDVILAVTS